jgi:hypothetical protein
VATWFTIPSGSFYVGRPYVQPLDIGPSLDTRSVGPSHVLLWEAHRNRDFGP